MKLSKNQITHIYIVTVETLFNKAIIPLPSVMVCVTPRFQTNTLWIATVIIDKSWISYVIDKWVF